MEKKKFRKKLLAILMIICIVAADFFVLSSNLTTYADEIKTETNNENVKFSAYFKNDENQIVDSIEKSIKSEDLKLYAKIEIKNEGYLNEGATIEILNSNFNIKNNILSHYISSINANKVTLKQINVGEIELVFDIEPISSEKLPLDMLSKISIVKLNGTYTGSNGGGIQYGKEVCLSYKPDSTATAELKTEIKTNKVLSVDGTDKMIIQLLIKSRLTENQYPVEYTKLTINIPQLSGNQPEDISILAIGKLATNGEKVINSDNLKIQDGKLEITLDNKVDDNKEITWIKDTYDEIIVTFIYDKDVDTSGLSLTTNSELKVYNFEETYKCSSTTESDNLGSNNVIMVIPQITTKEIYKGQLYANIKATEKKDIPYETQTTVVIANEKVNKEIIINEGSDEFVLTDDSTVLANTKYISTQINSNKLLEILGDKGKLQLTNGTITTTLDKEQIELNGNENIIITHGTDSSNKLEIRLIEPENAGVIEIQHSKVITGQYTRNQIKTIKELKTKSEDNLTEAIIEIKETTTKAELEIMSKENLSTTETNNLILGITLITHDEKYDLYGDSKIQIQLPSIVEDVVFNTIPTMQNVKNNEIAIKNYNYNKTNKQITITVEGEQTAYPEGTLSQLYIPLDLNVTISKLATTKNDKIIMSYTNENASQYYNDGVTEKTIGISAQPGLLKFFNISSNEDTSLTNSITQIITDKATRTENTFETILVNNTGADINDVKILGKLPTTGIEENTFETKLKTLTAQNATIYFTENSNATVNVEDEGNGWTTDRATLTNAKQYLIKLDTLAQGDNYTALSKIQLPNKIEEDLQSYTQYEVIYDVEGDTKTENSRMICLKSASELDVDLTAQVGNEIIKNEDKVKEGEVIKYTATVTNNTGKTLENVELKANIPEGTVLVEPVEMYVYRVDPFYYEEKTDINEKSITIPTLAPEETYTTQYEVRVKMDAVTTVTEISNKAIVTNEDLQKESKEIKNILENSDIRVTIKRADDESVQLLSGHVANYKICVENFSDIELKDIELQVISDEYNLISITNREGSQIKDNTIYEENKIKISKIPANGNIIFSVYGEIAKDVEELNIYANVGNANKSNIVTEELPRIETQISLGSSHNNQSIKPNEQVTYDISIKNIGETIDGKITIQDVIPDYLSVESISVNGEIKLQVTDETNKNTYIQNISNEIKYSLITKIESEETLNITIVTKVKEIPNTVAGEVITNKVDLLVYNVHEATSQEIKHVLDSGEKNIITGFAWIDENSNGQKDDYESALTGVSISLYDISRNSYLKDGDDNVIKTETDIYGQYTFLKIPNGSYILVFEHQLENYVPTISFAEGVESDKNSKAKLEEIIVNGETINVAGIKIVNIKDDIIIGANIGLKQKTEVPEEPDNPDQPDNPDEPENPEQPDTPDEPEIQENRKEITGNAWLDENRNGQKDDEETALDGVNVKIYDVSKKDYLKDENGNVIQTTTDSSGKYKFENIEKGSYIVIFEYDIKEYEPTTYMAEGVDTTKSSKVVLKKININGEDIVTAVTDTINLQENVANINIGLKEKLIFDLELNKYISKIVVQTSEKTKTYDYDNKTFAKVEIHRKQINGSFVVLEYTMKVKNNGEAAGYVKNLVDYLPNGLTFNSELNKDWYLSGNYLYTKNLENIELQPGEEKEIKLILTKTMTNENTGLINNRAEIYQDYNEYGIIDIDSTPNNQIQEEDDIGTADVIVLVSTGGGNIIIYIILALMNMILISVAVRLMIENNIIKISTKRERR